MRGLIVGMTLLALGACGDENVRRPRPTRLRITTHAGLEPMVAGVPGTFTRHLANLVFSRASDFFETGPVLEGNRITFKRRSDVARSTAELAATMRAPGLRAATVKDDHVIAEFADDAQARNGLDETYLEVGPWRVASFTEGPPRRLVLVRDPPARGFRELEVTAVGSEEEEWRRFLAGDADMIPQIAPAYLGYLDDLSTVRVVQFSVRSRTGMLFRVGSDVVAAPEVRRAVSLALRRKALANYALHDEKAAVDWPEDAAEARRLLDEHRARIGKPIVLRVPAFDETTDMKRTALAVEQQLASFDVTIEWLHMTIAEAQRDFGTKEAPKFDAIILPGGGWEQQYWGIIAYSGYHSPELDDAMAAQDVARVRDILYRDVPVTPLYSAAPYIVADAKLCGLGPERMSNYLWLGDVHYCDEGAR